MTIGTPARQDLAFNGVEVTFSALRNPYSGQYGDNFAVALVFDKNTTSKLNLEVLGTLMKLLTKGGPVDIKDETGLNSTGKFKLTFNSKVPVPVFDANAELIPQKDIPLLGKGSIVNVKFVVAQGKVGVNKYIQGVQIVKLVPYVSDAPMLGGNLGFGKVEGYKQAADPALMEADFDAVFK